MSIKYVCDKCNNDNVYYDAYVNVNDPTDVTTFDATYCSNCGRCSVIMLVEQEQQ